MMGWLPIRGLIVGGGRRKVVVAECHFLDAWPEDADC